MSDWREAVLADISPLHRPGAERGPVPPGEEDAVRIGTGRIGEADAVVATWDFTVRGGSFGERDATAFAVACAEAASSRRPLLTLLRSGGTRLQEGMRALVGIPRALLALEGLAEAGVAHVAVVDHPTTGGVWVAIGARADMRFGISGATVGFSGPRVIEAMTGVAIGPGANTAESAAAAGLLDAVVDGHDAPERLGHVLAVMQPDDPSATTPPAPVGVPDRGGYEQVVASREAGRPHGVELLDALLPDAVALAGADDVAALRVGRLAGRRVVGVALNARRERLATVPAYELLGRGAGLADRLDAGLLVLVDTPGGDPLPGSEQRGVAAAISAAATAVLTCRAPSVSVVHGAGGSGGALAGAVTDVVGVTAHGWFAALGPEGAAATLRRPVEEVADALGLTPRELLASGFADALAPDEPQALGAWVAGRFEALRSLPRAERLAARRDRWSAPLPGTPRAVPTEAGGTPDIG